MKSSEIDINTLLEKLAQGNQAALARLLTLAENHFHLRSEIVTRLYPVQKPTRVIGITGAPGVGKSTLINQLLSVYKQQFERLAVLAFDPSSEISGGAILGDRLRMQDHGLDQRIYIRSLANRGHLGGVSTFIYDALIILAAFGFDLILVETVGVGQSEIEIMRATDMVVVVLTPAGGDDIQAMKAGIMEIGDIFAVNKADLPGAEAMVRDLTPSQAIGRNSTFTFARIVMTTAVTGAGVAALAEAIALLYQELAQNGTLAQRHQRRSRAQFEEILKTRWTLLAQQYLQCQDFSDWSAFGSDPYLAAEQALTVLQKSFSGTDL